MKILTAPRLTGKTTELIKMSAREDMPIICTNFNEAQILRKKARQMGLVIPTPVPVADIEYTYGKHFKGYLIDDLDEVMYVLTNGKPIYAATRSGEVYNMEEWKNEHSR